MTFEKKEKSFFISSFCFSHQFRSRFLSFQSVKRLLRPFSSGRSPFSVLPSHACVFVLNFFNLFTFVISSQCIYQRLLNSLIYRPTHCERQSDQFQSRAAVELLVWRRLLGTKAAQRAEKLFIFLVRKAQIKRQTCTMFEFGRI